MRTDEIDVPWPDPDDSFIAGLSNASAAMAVPTLEEMLAAIELIEARALLASVEFFAAEWDDDTVYVMAPYPGTREGRATIAGSPRALGALGAVHLVDRDHPHQEAA